MTAGVAVVLGPAGANFGSGMTGGLAYVSKEAAMELDYNREFLRAHAAGPFEQDCLRKVLSEHFLRTGSPRAEMLLDAHKELDLVRLAPIHFARTIEDTWAEIIERLEKPEAMPFGSLSRLLVAEPAARFV
jgi:glutamate synthase domain-containing protein 3